MSELSLILADGKVKQVMIKDPAPGEHVIFDAIRFTVDESTFGPRGAVTDDDIALYAGQILQRIFGFGVTAKLDKGRDFYDVGYMLGDNWGHIAFGGKRQRHSLVVSIMGQGLLASPDGWEKRLYDWLTTDAKKPKLTRCDLAHDWFNGEHTVDEMQALWESGKFDRYYNRPDFELVGPWLTHDKWGKGRSCYLGTRSASVLTRFYEKGKQLGGFKSPWTRAEAEIAARGVVIPFDILLHPTKYFCGLYPQFAEWFGSDPAKLVTEQKQKVKCESLEAQMAHTQRWCQNHYGPKLAVQRELLGDVALLDLICAKEKKPTVYKVSDLSFSPPPMTEKPATPANHLMPVGDDEENFVCTEPLTWDDKEIQFTAPESRNSGIQ